MTIFGLPIRIAPPQRTPAEASKLDRYKTQIKELKEKLDNKASQAGDEKKIKKKISSLKKTLRNYKFKMDKGASFDSELMLVKKDSYSLGRWLPNPYYLGFAKLKNDIAKDEVLMVSRLDGADADIVKRVITDTLEAEKKGLSGKAYFDARYKNPGEKKISGFGYAFYDRSIHRAAVKLSKTTPMKAVIDDTSSLFQQGDCPDAALYCGWYSLARYIDAFTWQKGSVGFHIASSECTTLKNPQSQVWCKKMLDNGIAATIGPVGEPYVQSFPVPEIFFPFLSEGILTLSESYLISLPYLSWKMVLVGDPLYRLNLKK